MPTPEQVFRAGTDSKRNIIRQVWPELYGAFAPAGPPPDVPLQVFYCVFSGHGPDRRVLAVARTQARPHGSPACAICLRRHERLPGCRPGGWPLPGRPGGGPPMRTGT